MPRCHSRLHGGCALVSLLAACLPQVPPSNPYDPQLPPEQQQPASVRGIVSGSRPALEELSFTQQPNVICPFCTNNCNRTVITFSSGDNFITGNRCERGEILGLVGAGGRGPNLAQGFLDRKDCRAYQ